MYGATTNRNSIPRYEQHDLGLTPREETRCQSDFSTSFRALLAGKPAPNNLLAEVGTDVRRRARLGEAAPGTLTIPTGARMWPAGRIDIQKRDASVAGTGSYLVATNNQSFIELLRNRTVIFQLGATRLSGLTGNVTIPKQTVGASAYWLSTETTAITEGNQTFAQVALTPRTVGAYTQISRLLQLQSDPSIDGLVAADLAAAVSTALDAAAINGTGSEQPQGIIGTANVGTFTGGSLDTAALLDGQVDLSTANALTGSSAYLTTPSVAGLLLARSRFTAGTDKALWEGSVLDGKMLGLRAMSSQQCPAATMILGNWSDLIVGEWGVLELAVSNSAEAGDFAKGISTIRAMLTADIAVRHAGAFSVATSIS